MNCRLQQVLGFSLALIGLLMFGWDFAWAPLTGRFDESFIAMFIKEYHMPGLLAMLFWALLIFIGLSFTRTPRSD